MGAGTFPIMNPTVGGGTAFNDIVAQLLATLAGTRTERAQVGTDIFSQLLAAETAARRRPVNIVDQLLLAGEFGSVMPLSQISGERLSQLGGRTNPALGNIFEAIQGFAQGAVPQGQVVNVIRRPGQPDRAVVRLPNGQIEIVRVPAGGGVQTVQGRTGPFSLSIPDIQNYMQRQEQRMAGLLEGRTPQERQQIIDYFTGLAEQTARSQETLADRFRTASPSDVDMLTGFLGAPAEVQERIGRFQFGGSLIADPRRRLTAGAGATGIQAAAPIRMVDRNQRTIGVAGEAGRPERVNVEPLPVGLGGRPSRAEAQPSGSFSEAFLAGLPRDVRFRLEEFMRAAPSVDPKTALSIAQRPGDFQAFIGDPSDPREVAARLLAGGIQSDVRFQNPLVRALALGRAPTSAQMGASEFAALPPDLRDALIGIIGEDQLPGFLFALQAGTPLGVAGARGQAVGGVRI